MMSPVQLHEFNTHTRRKSDRYPVERNGIFIVTSGQFHYRDRTGNDITLNAGDFLLYSSGDISKIKMTNDNNNFKAQSVVIDVALFQKFLSYSNAPAHAPCNSDTFIFTANDTSVVKLLELLKEQLANNDNSDTLEFLTLALLSEMVNKQPCLIPFIQKISVLTTSQQLIRYVEEHISADLTIDMVAPKLGMSASTLKRKLQSDKLSFAHLVKVKRINYAATQLRLTRKTITEIAYDTGFKTAAHFSTSFKSVKGITPKEFRDSLQG
ncbi:AraC family transcriptional regulator [Aliivibrio fischeri]|uniref:AraC family transcriptional regulator n=1 Tax=Aliivibrio fischeri TaxID=668 RepID=UPI00080E3961|nr:AraC family transcriptional regulator [Aliivibrio fischeri]OCH05074.1 AraC family transcriptional regulator [Aliivibrio fischeri]OCH10541.1 AraC family transcriptional regulator [Aliivibrio fischeri]OCH26296.1 AraC family transcriptional regulator [Aliivibrio fischeri]